jgi:plastocyanin
MKRIIWVLALALAAAVLVAAGCGDDDDDGGGEQTPAATEPAETEEPTEAPTEEAEDDGGGDGGGGEPLTLTADAGGAISWEPNDLTAPAGEVSIELVNESSVPHAIEVEGDDVEEESETVTGGNTTLTVELEPGEYELYCPVGNHRDQGMDGTLTVE